MAMIKWAPEETYWVRQDDLMLAYQRWQEAWPCPRRCDWPSFTGTDESPGWTRSDDDGLLLAYSKKGAERIRLIAHSPHYKAILIAIAIKEGLIGDDP